MGRRAVSALIVAAVAAASCAGAMPISDRPPAIEPDAGRAPAAAPAATPTDASVSAAALRAHPEGQLERAEAAYAALAADLAGRSGLAQTAVRLTTWPVSGRISSPFGPRWGGFHNGLDVAAPMFTPVRAAADGQVVIVGRPALVYGDTAVVVVIAHGSNLATIYAHLDETRLPPVTVGQRVRAGDVIGYVGLTGWTTGPHVHFMTVVDRRAVDPLPHLP